MSCFGCSCTRAIDDVDYGSTSRSNRFDKGNISSSQIKSKSTDKPLYTVKETFLCLFCGGKSCKHENYLKHPNPAIIGLNSDQIDSNIFASQRPSNVWIDEFKLIARLKDKNIGLIINVQRPGEHPYCGPNEGWDVASGYTYSPSKFRCEGISVKLCGWEDLSVPDSQTFMLEIVKTMYKTVKIHNKNVLVHCHAGYGRTGIVIVCYKIFTEYNNATKAIAELRAKRKKCIQNSHQQRYCDTFYRYICNLREWFQNSKNKKEVQLYLDNQNYWDVAEYNKELNYIQYNPWVPVLFNYSLNKIIDLFHASPSEKDLFYSELKSCEDYKLDKHWVTIIENINIGKWAALLNCEHITLIIELLYKWCKDDVTCVNQDNILTLFDEDGFDIERLNYDQLNYYLIKLLPRYEIEIIKYFSEFFQKIIDDTDNEEEIKWVLNKISKMWLGVVDVLPVAADKWTTLIYYLIVNTVKWREMKSKLTNIIEEDENLIGTINQEEKFKEIYLHWKDYFNSKSDNNNNNNTNDLGEIKWSNSMIQGKTKNQINKSLTRSVKFQPQGNYIYQKATFFNNQFKHVMSQSVMKNKNNNNNHVSENESNLSWSQQVSSVSKVTNKPWLKEEDC